MTLNHTEPIKKEGVYYTQYLFEVITKEKLENDKLLADKNNDYSDTDEHLKYLPDDTTTEESKPSVPASDSNSLPTPADG